MVVHMIVSFSRNPLLLISTHYQYRGIEDCDDMDDIRIKSRDPEGDDLVVLLGFPGSGLVGSIALSHMTGELEFQHIGNITSKFFPPLAMMVDGIVNAPMRIYQKDRYIIIISDVPIHPMICYEVAGSILGWLSQFPVSEVVVVAGIVTTDAEKRVFGVATNTTGLDMIRDKTEILPMGSITGIAGAILTECTVDDVKAIGLMGESVNAPDPRAAASVMAVLNEMYAFNVSIDPLIEQATEIEASLQQMAEQVEQAEQQPLKKENLQMYG